MALHSSTLDLKWNNEYAVYVRTVSCERRMGCNTEPEQKKIYGFVEAPKGPAKGRALHTSPSSSSPRPKSVLPSPRQTWVSFCSPSCAPPSSGSGSNRTAERKMKAAERMAPFPARLRADVPLRFSLSDSVRYWTFLRPLRGFFSFAGLASTQAVGRPGLGRTAFPLRAGRNTWDA